MLNAIVDALLPPASLALLAFLLLLARRRRFGLWLLAAFLALGTSVVAAGLASGLTVPEPTPGPEPAAIVILSADGVIMPKPLPLEAGGLTLERVRAGAALHRRTGLPILVSGGLFLGDPTPLAAAMTRVLQDDFQIPVRWQEDRSLDTWQNAEFSARMLREAGITRVYLVTHAWHMRRAMLAFRHFGLDPVPAPVRPGNDFRWSWDMLIPRAAAWQASYYALHEWVGLAFYALRR
jgi:uncharacterized SAM-binding protein YcdF (DUF218 family)